MNLNSEYDNRARVPEHAEIIAGWRNAAKARRAAGHCDLNIAYGGGDRQFFDIFWPQREADPDGPMVVFIHGGYWKTLDRKYFSHLSNGLNALGLPVIMPSYSLCPQVKISQIIEDIRVVCAEVWRNFGRKVTVSGHSAGGHLAAAMLATDWSKRGFAETPVQGGFSISGLFDLRPLLGVAVNEELHLDEDSAFAASPLLWKTPVGQRFESWVGGDESSEFIRQSATIEAVWSGVGAKCRHVVVPGKNHFTVIADLEDAQSEMTRTLAGLAGSPDEQSQ